MIEVNEAYNALTDSGIDLFTGVPDSLLKNFCAYITDKAQTNHIIAANEGNAVGIAAGHYLATGKPALVYMQNSGLGNAINPLLSLVDEKVYSIPMVLMIGWRGEPGVHDEPQHVKQGEVTLTLLDAMQIPYVILTEVSQIPQQVALAMQRKAPVALVIRKGTFGSYKLKNIRQNNNPLSREDAMKLVVNHLQADDVIVSTTGKLSRELFEYRETRNEGHGHDFLTVGSMGHSSSIALGIALEKKDRRVFCFDGDGAFIMHTGALGIVASMKPRNYYHILFNNNAHESVGGQPTIGYELDAIGLAKASGYNYVMRAATAEEMVSALQLLEHLEGPVLLELRVKIDSRDDLGRPTTTPIENKEAFMEFLNEKEKRREERGERREKTITQHPSPNTHQLKTAVIMAAGMGTRFGSMTEERPKGFIEVGGKSMVERSIETLIDCGIERIVIGTGYMREAYEALAEKYPQIECCFSPRFAETNSMFTLYNCREMVGDDDFLLLESDLVFERRAITAMLECPHPDVMLITPVTKFQDQYYVECDEQGRLTNCSVNKEEVCVRGELVGIHKLSSIFYHKMCTDYETKLGELPKLGYEYELLHMSQEIMPVYVLCEEGLKWYEIDDMDDLRYAEENIIQYL